MKYQPYKCCHCVQCQYGSKKKHKRDAHKAVRKAQRRAIEGYMRGYGDFECGPIGRGYWD